MIIDKTLFMDIIYSVFQLKVFVAIFIGTIGGIIVGAIPGLTAVMAISLLLPFSFYLEPIVGISFLIAVYKSAIMGGSIPAILISTPGTGAAAATVLDGFPLTQQGKGAKAIQMAIVASVFGETFSSILVFILFAFGMTEIALFFGSPEMGALILASFSLIIVISQSSLIKGFISACLGIVLALIGQDPVTAAQRFTFGILNLRDGLNIVPVMIGIFAIAEVMVQIERMHIYKKMSIVDNALVTKKGNSLNCKEIKNSFPTLIRSSAIGFIIGVIPGMGQSIAAFLSYAVAQKLSRNPNNFGKGSLEGIAAPEAGNNAVNAAALVPLLTFGIPGDSTTAVLLGAFIAHGLTPGIRLFQEHSVIIFGILFAMFITNVVMGVIALLGTRFFAKIAISPIKYLMPIVLLLCLIGSYSASNSMFDVGLMCVMGVLGYILKKFKIALSPLLITFILTRRFEMSLAQSLQLSGGSFLIFFKRPISLVLILTSVIIIILSIYDNFIKNKRSD